MMTAQQVESLRIQVAMEVVECPACGLPFAVPEPFLRFRERDHVPFCCPNRHWIGTLATRSERDAPAEVERRRSLLKALHDAEQGEAKRRDER